MKKTYIIPETCIADLNTELILALSYTNKQDAVGGNSGEYQDEYGNEYESDGY